MEGQELQEALLRLRREVQTDHWQTREDFLRLRQEAEVLALKHLQKGDDRGRPQPRLSLTKTNFPKFDGRDIHSWILRCDKWFRIDGTQEGLKIGWASDNLDPESYYWHLAMKNIWRGQLPTWEEYKRLLRVTFGHRRDKPMMDLIRLRQTSTLAEYNVMFEQLSAEVDLSEEGLVGVYVDGLQKEIADSVLLFDPRNLLEARRLARVQEISLNRRALREAKGNPAVGATPSSSKATSKEAGAVAATTNLILVPTITKEPEIQENEATPAVQIIPAPETSEEKGEGDGDASSGQASCSFADVGSSPTSSPPSEVPSGFVVAVPSSDVGEDAGTVINTNGTWEFDLVAEFPDAGSPWDRCEDMCKAFHVPSTLFAASFSLLQLLLLHILIYSWLPFPFNGKVTEEIYYLWQELMGI